MPVTGLIMQAVRNGGAVAPVAAAGGTTPVDPLLSWNWLWDMDRSTVAVNNDGSGGVPSNGSQLLYVSNIGTTDPTLVARQQSAKAGPLKQSDGAGGFYADHTAASQQVLTTPASTGSPAVPFAQFGVIRIPASDNGYIFGGGGTGFSPGIYGGTADNQIGAYNGGANGNVGAAPDAVWHGVAMIVKPNSLALWIDGVLIGTIADGGNLAIPAGLLWGWTDSQAGTYSSADWKLRGFKLNWDASDDAALAGWNAYLNSRRPA